MCSLSIFAHNWFARRGTTRLLGCGAKCCSPALDAALLLARMFPLLGSVVVFAFMMLILVTLYTANTGERLGLVSLHAATAPHANGASAGAAAMA